MALDGLARRRMLCGVVLALLYVLAGTSSSASAAAMTPTTTYEIDGSVHYFNQGAQDQNKIVTYNGYQYIAWWDQKDAEGHEVFTITRRRLSDDRREVVALNTEGGWLRLEGDYHNTPVLGLSKIDGRLHAAWTLHNREIKYAISNRGCLSKTRFSECTFTWGPISGDAGESRAAYDQFFTDVTGNLYIIWRYRNSENGMLLFAKYNNDGTWTHVGTIVNGATGAFDPDGTWTDTDRDGKRDREEPGYLGTSETRGIYVDGIMFDPNNRLHMMWSFRESEAATRNPEWGANLHDVYYAYSDDLGVTWLNNRGRQIGSLRAETPDPITIADHADALVLSVPVTYWRSNFGRMVLDWDWQPHIVTEISDAISQEEWGHNFRYRHVWRTKDGAWHDGWIEPAEQGKWYPAQGSVFFDRGNNAYFIGSVNEFDWIPYNSPTVEYNATLPISNVTWQQGRYMHIVPFTEITSVLTISEIGIPIGTRSTENSVIELQVRNDSDSEAFTYNFLKTGQRLWSITPTEERAREPAELYWESGETTGEFSVPANGRWQTVRLTVSAAAWRGTLRALEMYTGATTGSIDVDYIHIQNGSGTVAKRWEFNAGNKLIAAEAGPTDSYESWETYDLLADREIGNVSIFLDDWTYNIDLTRYELEGVVDFTTVRQGEPGVSRLHLEEFDIAGDDPFVKLWEWGVSGDEIGWENLSNVTGLTQALDEGSRVLSGSISAARPQIYTGTTNLHAAIRGADTIQVRMKNERAERQRGRICWTVNGGTTFREEQCTASFTVTADGRFHEYSIEPVGLPGWRAENELTRVRFEPASDGAVRRGRFSLDYIRIRDDRP